MFDLEPKANPKAVSIASESESSHYITRMKIMRSRTFFLPKHEDIEKFNGSYHPVHGDPIDEMFAKVLDRTGNQNLDLTRLEYGRYRLDNKKL